MRILMTTDTVGGVWTYAIQLIASLHSHSVHVALATLGGALSAAQRRQAAALPNVTLFESEYKLEWMDEPWADVDRTGDWLLGLERYYAPDLIHLNGYSYGQRPFTAPVLMVAHSCCVSWWEAVKRESPPPSLDRYREEVRAGLAGADLIVGPSRGMLNAIERLYSPAVQTRVIYNGRQRANAAPCVKQNVILSAGRLWDDAKNLSLLQTVAADVPWPIRVAGGTTHPDGRTIPSDGIEWLGVLDEDALAQRMNEAAIYAMPALYEPFGLSILEAALAECALVLGDIPSLREIWGDSAVYVDPTRPADLGAALNALITHPDRRNALASRSSHRARRYSPAAMAEHYLDAYRSLIEPSDRTNPADRIPETVA